MIDIFTHFFLFSFIIYFNGFFFIKILKYDVIQLNKFEISLFGLIFTGLSAQIINFFSPLNEKILILNIALIIILIILYRKIDYKFLIKKFDFLYIILFLLIIINIFGSGFSDDLNHYHYSYIGNSDNSNYIIGLGHLHEMYAYSSIWLITQSYFNFDYSRLQDIHVINGLVFFVFLSIFYSEINKNFYKKKIDIYFPIIFFITIFVLLKYTRLKEFGIDRPPFLIFYFFLLFYLKNFFLPKDKNKIDIKIILLIYICIFLFFTKIIFFVTGLIPLYYIIKYKKYGIFVSKSFLPLYLFILSYLIKNILISGCLIFPITFTCFDFLSWSTVEIAKNQYIVSEILNKSWWLYKGTLTELEYIKNFNWFITWFNTTKIELLEFLLTSIFIIFLTFFCFKKVLRQNNKSQKNKIIEISGVFFIFFLLQLILFIFKLPVIRMSHSLFVLFSILILITIFFNFEIIHKKRIVIAIFSISVFFNFSKNLIRISENDFANDPFKLIKHKVYNQEKLKLDQFEYYSGWYGNYPTGNVTLKDSYSHKKILIFNMIYKN